MLDEGEKTEDLNRFAETDFVKKRNGVARHRELHHATDADDLVVEESEGLQSRLLACLRCLELLNPPGLELALGEGVHTRLRRDPLRHAGNVVLRESELLPDIVRRYLHKLRGAAGEEERRVTLKEELRLLLLGLVGVGVEEWLQVLKHGRLVGRVEGHQRLDKDARQG